MIFFFLIYVFFIFVLSPIDLSIKLIIKIKYTGGDYAKLLD